MNLLLTALLALLLFLPVPPATAADIPFGETFAGVAKSGKTGKHWPFEISFDRLDERSPETLWGQVAWPSLRSVHTLDARLAGDTLSFTEIEAVEKGKANLAVRYEGKILGAKGERRVEGTYVDPNGDRGSFFIDLTEGGGDLRALGFLGARPLPGEAKSGKTGKSWPFVLTLNGERATELFDFDGTLEWPTLASKHLVRGLYKGGRLLFEEVEAVKKGKARLRVKYELWRDGNGLTGTYADPKGDRGSVWIPLE